MKALLLFVALFSFLAATAQDPETVASTKDHKIIKSTRFGFKGGYNHSDVVGRETNGAKTGYIGGELYGGFFAKTVLSERFNLEPELLFSWTDDYHFIELPVHLEYLLARKWSVFAGPKLDYIVDNDNAPSEYIYDFKNFGISADMGIQFTIYRSLFAELRHSRSFTEQVTNRFLDINQGKRHTYRIGLGIVF